MKKCTLILVAMLFSVVSFAQKGKVNTAEFEAESGNLLKAKEAIDQAVGHEETKLMARTWKVKGDVYSKIYETKIFLAQAPDALLQAYDAYKKAFELETNPKKKGDTKVGMTNLQLFLYQEGVKYFQEENFPEAYRYMDASRQLNQFMLDNQLADVIDTMAVLVTAYSAQNMQNYDVAVAHYKKLFDMSANNETVYSNLADLLMVQKAPDEEVLKVINKGREKYPNDKDLIISELNYYLSKGQAANVTDKLENAIKADPNNASLYFALGTAYDQLKNEEKALQAYQNAIAKRPDYYDAYFNLGVMYYNKAVEINKQMNATPDNDMKTYKKLEAERNALYNQALPYLEKAYEINPQGADNKSALKEIYARMNMFDKLNSLK